MEPNDGEILRGGMMNSPRKFGDEVHRQATDSTPTIHRLLRHVRSAGIDWVPEPKGISGSTEILSYIHGEVPHDMPHWIWNEAVVRQVAGHLRDWHDATLGFDLRDANWSLETKTVHEVICHNDFAPYNCVFRDGSMVGLIDFDLCAPGSRLWDMAYTAYRYVPVLPPVAIDEFDDISPFSRWEIETRLGQFLDAYAKGDPSLRFSSADLLRTMRDRLQAIAEWTEDCAARTGNSVLARNSVMYGNHARWISSELSREDKNCRQ